MKKVLAIGLGLICLAMARAERPADLYGYKALRWGNTIAQVRAKYPNMRIDNEINDDNVGVRVKGYSCSGSSYAIDKYSFSFYNGKLYKVLVDVKPEMDIVKSVVAALVKKYGTVDDSGDSEQVSGIYTLKFSQVFYEFKSTIIKFTVCDMVVTYTESHVESRVALLYYSTATMKRIEAYKNARVQDDF